jgi:hypothetical protein
VALEKDHLNLPVEARWMFSTETCLQIVRHTMWVLYRPSVTAPQFLCMHVALVHALLIELVSTRSRLQIPS